MCIVTDAGVSAEGCLQFANNFSVNHRRSYELYLGSSARKAWACFSIGKSREPSGPEKLVAIRLF